jgi:hypothetical protein
LIFVSLILSVAGHVSHSTSIVLYLLSFIFSKTL